MYLYEYSSATITDSTFTHNSAGNVSSRRSRLPIGVASHVRAWHPIAPRPQGGAIRVESSSVTTINSAFANNSAGRVRSSRSRHPIVITSHVRAFLPLAPRPQAGGAMYI